MSDLTFAQPSSRNLAAPIIIAVTLLGGAAGAIYRTIPHTDAGAKIIRVDVHPVETLYKKPDDIRAADRKKVHDVNEQELYLIPMVRIDNHLGVALDLKDFTVDLVTSGGATHASAIERADLSVVYAAFPEVMPLMEPTLLRETSVPPKQFAQGNLLFQLRIPQAEWDQRQSATLTIDFYRQSSITIPFPKPS